MRVPRFYCPELTANTATMMLPDTVHRHAVQVLRLKKGDIIRIFDGKGLELEAEFTDIQKRQSIVDLRDQVVTANESSIQITLMQGISRGERMDYAIQKAVELGVNQIIPVSTERCNVQLNGGRADKRLQHWHGVMVSACEQSGRAFLPELSDVKSFSEVIQSDQYEKKLILDPEAGEGFNSVSPAKSAALLIGPEGGFTEDEKNQAMSMNFIGVKFGPRILRTETASTAALAVIQTLWGDLG